MTFRKPKTEPELCLPDETGWRLWDRSAPVAAPRALAPGHMAEIPRGTLIGLPAGQLVSVPLWLQTADAAVYKEMAEVQLERRGLLRDGLTAWDCLLIHQEGGRSLVTAFLVNSSLPAALQVSQAGGYDVAARYRPLPENAFVFWREQRGIAVAATRNHRLAALYFFPEAEHLQGLAGELGALRRALAGEGVTAPGMDCVAWGEFDAHDLSAAAAALGSSARQEPMPLPIVPTPSLFLAPPGVTTEQKRQEKSGQRRSLYLYMAAAYALLALAVGAALGWQARQIGQLSRASRIDAPTVERLSGAAAAWKAVAPAIDSSYYPMECLLACVKILPQEVRFTDFEHSPSKVLVQGEGKDAASIFRFLAAVKDDPFLKKWTWTMPQPQLLPNNRAQFRLEGTRGPSTQ